MSILKRVLFIGDSHADDSQPVSRKDNYLESIIAKLYESLEIAKKKQVDAVIHLGDVFNRMEPGGDCRNRVLSAFQHDKDGNPWPFKIYVCIGNHDIRNNPMYLSISALGTLIESGVIETTDYDEDLNIAFMHFRVDVVEQLKNNCLSNYPAVIWVTHAPIVTKPCFGKYILFDQVPTNNECKLIVNGHVHYPMFAKRSDGVNFINPGSICRNALNEDNLNRFPKVLYLEYNTDGSFFKPTLIVLKSAKPAKDVFKVEEMQARKNEQKDTQKYMQLISSSAIWNLSEDKYEELRQIGKKKKLPDEVIELAITTLQNINDII